MNTQGEVEKNRKTREWSGNDGGCVFEGDPVRSNRNSKNRNRLSHSSKQWRADSD
ncbi:MAG: hypothetical protein IKD90_01830 [Clostridiales bacterium]|nr:hypothetical protein [Clostridiales bacterium]